MYLFIRTIFSRCTEYQSSQPTPTFPLGRSLRAQVSESCQGARLQVPADVPLVSAALGFGRTPRRPAHPDRAQALREGTWGLCVQQALSCWLTWRGLCGRKRTSSEGAASLSPCPAPSPSGIFTLSILLQWSECPSWDFPVRLVCVFHSESPRRHHLSLTSKLFGHLGHWNTLHGQPPSDSLQLRWAAIE